MNKKVIIGSVAAVVAAMFIILIVTSLAGKKEVIQYNKTFNMQYNDGKVLEVEEGLFFVDTINDNFLYRQYEGATVKVLEKNVSYLNYYKGKLYYINDEDNKIYKYNIKKSEELLFLEKEAKRIFIKDKFMYVHNMDGKVEKVSLKDGEGKLVLDKEVDTFSVYGDVVLYLENNYLYAANKKIIDYEVKDFVLDENYLVVLEEGDFNDFLIVHNAKTLGELNTVEIKEEIIGNYVIHNNKLYYTASGDEVNSTLYALNLKTGEANRALINEMNVTGVYKTINDIVVMSEVELIDFYVRDKHTFSKEKSSNIDDIIARNEGSYFGKAIYNQLFKDTKGKIVQHNKLGKSFNKSNIDVLIGEGLLVADELIGNNKVKAYMGADKILITTEGKEVVFDVLGISNNTYYLNRDKRVYVFDKKTLNMEEKGKPSDNYYYKHGSVYYTKGTSLLKLNLTNNRTTRATTFKQKIVAFGDHFIGQADEFIYYYNFETKSERKIIYLMEESRLNSKDIAIEDEFMYVNKGDRIERVSFKTNKVEVVLRAVNNIIDYDFKIIDGVTYITTIEENTETKFKMSNIYIMTKDGMTVKTYTKAGDAIGINRIENAIIEVDITSEENRIHILYNMDTKEEKVKEMTNENYSYKTKENKEIRVAHKLKKVIEIVNIDARKKRALVVEEK